MKRITSVVFKDEKGYSEEYKLQDLSKEEIHHLEALARCFDIVEMDGYAKPCASVVISF